MHTSYFGNFKNLQNAVSISQRPPWWYTGPQYKVLAPPWELVKQAHYGHLTEHGYRLEYIQTVLSKLNPREVYDHLVITYGEDCTLLCFEDLKSPGDYCHRRIVAQWFEDSLGVEVPEWKPPPRMRSTLSW